MLPTYNNEAGTISLTPDPRATTSHGQQARSRFASHSSTLATRHRCFAHVVRTRTSSQSWLLTGTETSTTSSAIASLRLSSKSLSSQDNQCYLSSSSPSWHTSSMTSFNNTTTITNASRSTHAITLYHTYIYPWQQTSHRQHPSHRAHGRPDVPEL